MKLEFFNAVEKETKWSFLDNLEIPSGKVAGFKVRLSDINAARQAIRNRYKSKFSVKTVKNPQGEKDCAMIYIIPKPEDL